MEQNYREVKDDDHHEARSRIFQYIWAIPFAHVFLAIYPKIWVINKIYNKRHFKLIFTCGSFHCPLFQSPLEIGRAHV